MTAALEKGYNDSCIFIGIDFGTTYSGVAWAWSRNPDDVHIVTNWSTAGLNLAHIQDDSKVPTAISYRSDGSVLWGFGASLGRIEIRWFKLLLLEEKDLDENTRNSPFLEQAREALRKAGKTPEEAVADYLRELWQHAISVMKQERGTSGVDGLPFKVTITVPAIWKPYAVGKMREAAKAAGILDRRACGKTSLFWVPEPEAAAMAMLREFEGRHEVSVGDVYVVCDVGGGTADIISYEVITANPLSLRETIAGTGKMCGAIFVDEAFRTLLEQKTKKYWHKLSQSSIAKLMNDQWEFTIKRQFDIEGPHDQRAWPVTLPAEIVPSFGGLKRLSLKNELKHGEVQFQTGHIRGVFERTINSIRNLVSVQVKRIVEKHKKQPKAIILVGGFGACNYLYRQLNSQHSAKGIEVMHSRGPGPWTAICRGAVLKARFRGEGSIVTSRVSRFSYGIVTTTDFEAKKHLRRDRFYDELEEKHFATNQMRWYVMKGDNIGTLQPIRIDLYEALETAIAPTTVSFQLYQCGEDKPPDRREESVELVCTVTVPLDVRAEQLTRATTKSGKEYSKFEFDIGMTTEDAGLKFGIYVDDVPQGDGHALQVSYNVRQDIQYQDSLSSRFGHLDVTASHSSIPTVSPVAGSSKLLTGTKFDSRSASTSQMESPKPRPDTTAPWSTRYVVDRRPAPNLKPLRPTRQSQGRFTSATQRPNRPSMDARPDLWDGVDEAVPIDGR